MMVEPGRWGSPVADRVAHAVSLRRRSSIIVRNCEAAAHAFSPSSAANGRSDDAHRDQDSDELCLLGIGPLRGGLSVVVRRDTVGNAAPPARRPPAAKNFRFAPGGFLNLHSQHRFPAPSL